MTDDELWTVTPIPRADVTRRLLETRDHGTSVFVFDGPVEPWRLAALVPDPLRRRTLLDRLCWWRDTASDLLLYGAIRVGCFARGCKVNEYGDCDRCASWGSACCRGLCWWRR